jgi:hypothetical protein
LLTPGTVKFRAAPIAPVRLRIAYCAEEVLMFVAELVPSVLVNATLPTLISTVKLPAIAMSKYAVTALFTSSPQVPDSVPVTGCPRARLVV